MNAIVQIVVGLDLLDKYEMAVNSFRNVLTFYSIRCIVFSQIKVDKRILSFKSIVTFTTITSSLEYPKLGISILLSISSLFMWNKLDY